MTSILRVKFPGHNSLLLDGRLELPSTTPRFYATFSHCFTCTKDMLAAYRISKALTHYGIAVLRFDFAGLGGSAGEFSATNFSTTCDDLLGAINFLDTHYTAPQLLIGHSMGGTTALACAGNAVSVKGVVTIASPSQPKHVLHHFGEAYDYLRQGLPSNITVAGQNYTIDPQFIDDIERHDMRTILAALDKPVLIFTITHDELVAAHNALDIQTWLAGKATLVTLPDADHILSNKHDIDTVCAQINAWSLHI